MEFNGFKIYPIGNAKLNIENDVLRVSGISNTGLDGVLIDTQGRENYTVNFGQLGMIAERKGVLKTSTLKRNKLNQVVTSFESLKWLDEEKGKIISGYNLDYLPEDFTVFGKLEGENVFEIPGSDLGLNEDTKYTVAWIPIATLIVSAIAVAVTIWSELRTKKTTSTKTFKDAEGNVTKTEETVSEDPVPFEIEVNGKFYTVDEYGIKYERNIPDELIGNPMVEYETIAEQITGFDLGEFEITSIEVENR